eukprot:31295-Pelagococcus_subviridis.AAC.9
MAGKSSRTSPSRRSRARRPRRSPRGSAPSGGGSSRLSTRDPRARALLAPARAMPRERRGQSISSSHQKKLVEASGPYEFQTTPDF